MTRDTLAVAANLAIYFCQNFEYYVNSQQNKVLLGGLRVTNPTIRLACPSVCPSVRPSVCPSVRQHFACKHDNSTNIRRIDSKLIPWMYLRSVLVKFEDG